MGASAGELGVGGRPLGNGAGDGAKEGSRFAPVTEALGDGCMLGGGGMMSAVHQKMSVEMPSWPGAFRSASLRMALAVSCREG